MKMLIVEQDGLMLVISTAVGDDSMLAVYIDSDMVAPLFSPVYVPVAVLQDFLKGLENAKS